MKRKFRVTAIGSFARCANTVPAAILALAVAVSILLLPAVGHGQVPEGLVRDGAGRVVEVVDGDTVILDTGDEVRLVGMQAPKLPLGRPDFEPWPLADDAAAALTELVLGERVDLLVGGRSSDRHGRRLAHVVRSRDGLWIQQAMIESGWARVYSFADNRVAVADLYRAERSARADRLGIWSDPFYALRRPDGLRGLIDTFQVVEGVVLDAADVRGRTYLNFGPDWRTDFTVMVEPRDRRLFEAAGIDLLGLTGARIQVRGWLDLRNGPMIVADHPEQLELLDPAPSP